MDSVEKALHECNEGIRLIRNFRNRFDIKKLSAEDRKKLISFDLRVAIRKGFALAKLNRVSDAIQEYERALKIDPDN